MDNVVHIVCHRKVMNENLISSISSHKGTGIHIGDGFILTNYHVVPLNTINAFIYSTTTGMKHEMIEIVKYSKYLDLVLFKTDMQTDWTIKIGKTPNISDQIKLWGFLSDINLSYIESDGKVMSFIAAGAYERHDAKCLYMLCDAVAGPGFSGGPVMNKDGDLVGLASAKLVQLDGVLFIPSLFIERFMALDGDVDSILGFSYLRIYNGSISKNLDCCGIDIGDKVISINGYNLRNGYINIKDMVTHINSDIFIIPYFLFPLFNAGDVITVKTDKGDKEHTLHSVTDYFGNNNYRVIDDLVISDIYNDFLHDMIIDDTYIFYRYGRPTPYILSSFNRNYWNIVGKQIVNVNTVDDIDDNITILYDYGELQISLSNQNKYYDT